MIQICQLQFDMNLSDSTVENVCTDLFSHHFFAHLQFGFTLSYQMLSDETGGYLLSLYRKIHCLILYESRSNECDISFSSEI